MSYSNFPTMIHHLVTPEIEIEGIEEGKCKNLVVENVAMA
jgi:hypothetical protein